MAKREGRQVVGSPIKTRPFSVCGTATKLVLSRVERLLLPRNFIHRVQGDPSYHNNRKWLLFARRRAAAADRPEKRALSLSWWTSNERYGSSSRRIFTNEVPPFRLGKDLSIGTALFKIRAKMISQRRFKAIDDYPSKFDWPGIKGLMLKKPSSVVYRAEIASQLCIWRNFRPGACVK